MIIAFWETFLITKRAAKRNNLDWDIVDFDGIEDIQPNALTIEGMASPRIKKDESYYYMSDGSVIWLNSQGGFDWESLEIGDIQWGVDAIHIKRFNIYPSDFLLYSGIPDGFGEWLIVDKNEDEVQCDWAKIVDATDWYAKIEIRNEIANYSFPMTIGRR